MIKITVPATSANLASATTRSAWRSRCTRTSLSSVPMNSRSRAAPRSSKTNRTSYTSRSSTRCANGARSPSPSSSTSTPMFRRAWLGEQLDVRCRGHHAAAALTGHTVDRAELVRIATAVEGHPDNVAPAILGGAVCSFTPEGGLPRCLRYDVSDRLRFIAVIPPYEVHTSEARKVVPQEVPLSSAVWQMGRIAGMTRGLETGDLALIADANDDRLQEPYRRASSPTTTQSAPRAFPAERGRSGSPARAPPSWPSPATPSWPNSCRCACASSSPPARRHILTCDTEAPRSSICNAGAKHPALRACLAL